MYSETMKKEFLHLSQQLNSYTRNKFSGLAVWHQLKCKLYIYSDVAVVTNIFFNVEYISTIG